MRTEDFSSKFKFNFTFSSQLRTRSNLSPREEPDNQPYDNPKDYSSSNFSVNSIWIELDMGYVYFIWPNMYVRGSQSLNSGPNPRDEPGGDPKDYTAPDNGIGVHWLTGVYSINKKTTISL